ncbi:MAG: hypothetical protein WC702_02875 [Patescibacteria group bacterium]|jgi:hypothetical protein
MEAVMAETRIVETLEAEAGRQWEEKKEAIGTYRRSIVFLPKGVQPGERVRVILQEVRADGRGRMMYRGTPAPDEKVREWRAVPGALECVDFLVNWKLQKTEIRILETRPIVRRDGDPIVRATFAVEWTSSFENARVKVETKTEIPELEEQLDNYSREPRKVEIAHRDGGTATEIFALDAVEPGYSHWSGESDFVANRLCRVDYEGEPTLHLTLKVAYSGRTSETSASLWSDLPAWLKTHLAAPYPVCNCGRARVDTAAGQTVCALCEKEQAFEVAFPMEQREALAAEATKLAAAEAIEGTTGEIILRSQLAAVSDSYRREQLVRASAGFAWYFFADDGVWGSKFPQPVMQVLAVLASAGRQGLHELAAWMAGPHQQSDYRYDGSYWHRTQVKGETVGTPDISVEEIANFAVAVRVGESTASAEALNVAVSAARSAAWFEAFPRAVRDGLNTAASHRDFAVDCVAATAARQALAATETARPAAEALFSRAQAGEALVPFTAEVNRRYGTADAWVIQADGAVRPHDSDNFPGGKAGKNGQARWDVVETDELAIWWASQNDGSNCFAVAHAPAGLTSAQREAVERIEREIAGHNCGNGELTGRGFGLRPGVSPLPNIKRVLEVARAEVISLGGWTREDREAIEVWTATWPQLCAKEGAGGLYNEYASDPTWLERVRRVATANITSGSRDVDVAVLRQASAGNGLVEVIYFRKYGKQNLAVRWRELRPGERLPQSAAAKSTTTPAPAPAAKPASGGSIDLSGLTMSGFSVRGPKKK